MTTAKLLVPPILNGSSILLSPINGWSIAISSSWSVTIPSFAAVKTTDARAIAAATAKINRGRLNTSDTQSCNSRDNRFIPGRSLFELFSIISEAYNSSGTV